MGLNSLSLRPDPSAPRVARRRLKAILRDVPSRALDDILLLTTELLTNSLRHAELDPNDRVRLVVKSTKSAVRVAITDPGHGEVFAARHPGPHDTGGRGLLLVAEMSDRWGVDRSQATTVWFEVSLVERLASRAG
jgi:anti-sigma regulatory factor (Ser/Thr protein kinase)